MANFIKKLLGKSNRPAQTSESDSGAVITRPSMSGPATVPLKEPLDIVPRLAEEKKTDIHQFMVGYGQSVGRQRDHNEDALFTMTTTVASDNTPVPFGLYIVADGMGGHQHGEIASGAAVRAMASHIIRKLYIPLLSLPQETPNESLQEIMQSGLYEAHRAILKFAPGGGTTMTAVLVMGEQMTITHVGDSRAYAIHSGGHMQVLTRDHSLVKRLEELGQITPEEAAQHPQRNVLYRALGQGEPFEPDIITFPLHHPGYLFLCSDGLWGVVPEKEIYDMISSAPNPQQACQELIDAANANGGPDNITAILIRIPE